MNHPRSLLPLGSLSFLFLATAACSGPGAGQNAGTKSISTPPAATKVHQVLAGKVYATSPKATLKAPPKGPFGFSLVASADGKKTDIKHFQLSTACAECHPRQWKELKGSMHSVAHKDTLYRLTAELALKEAGPAVYAYCSGCHTPQGVASKLVPQIPDPKLPDVVTAGIQCDTCHAISALKGHKSPWGEPGNASFVLSPDEERKFGPPTGDDKAADHPVKTRAFFQKSEFCASCHTVIHPHNGVRIEHTYAEWKKSIYAKKGIQCQDCHMRTVEQAIQVAKTLKPIVPQGKSSEDGKVRPIGHHFFVGGNANADRVGGGAGHAKMAEARLKSAATLAIEIPKRAAVGKVLRFVVAVTNVGAGHNLPTSVTELRQMWVDLTIKDATGKRVFRSGALDKNGDLDRQAMRFTAEAGDKNGKLTYKPWEVTHFIWKRLIKPKATARDAFTVPIPTGTKGPLTIDAKLLYRNAPPVVLKLVYPAGKAPTLRTVEMAHTTTTVAISPASSSTQSSSSL